MRLPVPTVLDVTNPESLVICFVCEALPPADRRERRSQMMVRMLEDARPLRRRAS
jgi:hypothetical protein